GRAGTETVGAGALTGGAGAWTGTGTGEGLVSNRLTGSTGLGCSTVFTGVGRLTRFTSTDANGRSPCGASRMPTTTSSTTPCRARYTDSVRPRRRKNRSWSSRSNQKAAYTCAGATIPNPSQDRRCYLLREGARGTGVPPTRSGPTGSVTIPIFSIPAFFTPSMT